MTTAYDQGLPCQNRSCKSYGKPHPNCRCYPGLAHGGETRFCADTRAHEPGCEYFEDGGEVIAPEDVVPDAPTPEASAAPEPAAATAAPEISPDDVIPDAPAGGAPINAADVIPDQPPHPPEYWDDAPAGSKVPDEAWAALGRENEKAAAVGFTMAATPIVGAALESIPLVEQAAAAGPWVKKGIDFAKGALASGLIQGADETSKALLGQGNTDHSVAAILTAAGVGGLISAGAGALSDSAQAAAKKVPGVVGKLMSYMMGFGVASETPLAEREAVEKIVRPIHEENLGVHGVDFKTFQNGAAAFDDLVHGGLTKAARRAGGIAGSFLGAQEGVMGMLKGQLEGWAAGYTAGKILEPIAGWTSKKILAPVAWKIIDSGLTLGILRTLSSTDKMVKGFNMVANASEAILKGITTGAIDAYLSPRELEQADAFIEQGGQQEKLQQQIYQDNAPPVAPAFAEGGEVHKRPAPPGSLAPVLDQPDGFAIHYPVENMALHAAKGRISGYLQSLRPGSLQPQLAFDKPRSQDLARKKYERALHLAAKPLGILEEVRKGTLQQEHLQHFNAMHPEMGSLLKDQLAKAITKAQLKGERPPPRVRQGLSMLLGTPLSSEYTPAGIQAAQAVFQAQKQQAQPQPGQASKPKKSTAPLAKADKAYLTSSQARDARQQKV